MVGWIILETGEGSTNQRSSLVGQCLQKVLIFRVIEQFVFLSFSYCFETQWCCAGTSTGESIRTRISSSKSSSLLLLQKPGNTSCREVFEQSLALTQYSTANLVGELWRNVQARGHIFVSRCMISKERFGGINGKIELGIYNKIWLSAKVKASMNPSVQLG